MPARKRLTKLADPMDDLAQLVLGMTPDELAIWTSLLPPGDMALIEHVIAHHRSLGWRTDPASFAAHLDHEFRIRPYVALLSRKFRQAVMGESKRQVWSLAARYGKSINGSQWGPLWALDHTQGRARFILWSYGQMLAAENAIGIRDRIVQHRDELDPGCQLAPGRKRMDRFSTVAGGGVVAAGVEGAVRGFGAGAGGGIIVDDPFKDWQQAHSENRRNFVWNQYRGTLLDRLDDSSAFILVIHHRVHEDDLTGRLLDDDPETWDHTCLPALAAAEGDPLGRAPGEPLDPERFSREFIEDQIRAMGTYLASALILQNPTPEEGTDLKRAWFRLYGVGDDSEFVLPAAPDQTLTSWDLKLRDKEAGDFVVGQAWWRTGPDHFLVDQMRGQWDHASTANAIALLAVRRPECRTHVIEAAGAYEEVAQQLRKPQPGYVVSDEMAAALGMTALERDQVQQVRRRGLSGIVPHPVKGDKRVRARTYIAPVAEAGNVYLPAYPPPGRLDFTGALLDELAAFPNATFDDAVDAASQALQRLGVGVAVAAAASGRVGQAPTPRPAPGRARVNSPQGRRQLPGPRRFGGSG